VPLGEVLAQQPVGVLVGSALPRGVGIAEVHGHAGGFGDLRVVDHLLALIPRPRPAQPLGGLASAAVTASRTATAMWVAGTCAKIVYRAVRSTSVASADSSPPECKLRSRQQADAAEDR